eukprot:3323-Heterococcus_DN1.PRE.1
MAALQTLSLQAVVDALTAAGVAGKQIDKDSLPPKIADDVVRFASENGVLTDALLVSLLDSGGLHSFSISNAPLAVTDASLMKVTQKHCSSFESIQCRIHYIGTNCRTHVCNKRREAVAALIQVGWSPQLEAVATVLDRLVLAGVELDKAAAATAASLSSASQ